ncbi:MULTISPECIES: hypothetical protein [unclassified Nocardioides]|uniref:hypothetical protein n=1 Tax=unclassified Nocardioides TaxID=2615069 RepID=UPI0011517E77|nr:MULTISPECIES: hypothetical protein [unclassified Nocardioides]TQK72457.1 hypothetical protein FBY23_4270 [Nocardioides sp. SLBN-35]WGY03346.1 hypothetical protein QI633_06180 [Nocardioides sp. QY071]
MHIHSSALTRWIGAPAVTAALVVVGTAVPALASTYYSAANPLQAIQDGKSQAESFGAFSIKNLSYAHNGYSYRDPRAGGDAVYVETFYDWYQGSTLKSQVGTDTSPKYAQSAWTASADQQVLYIGGNGVRISTNVCEDHGALVKDPCSIKPTKFFNY